jgi:alpha-galactosidase
VAKKLIISGWQSWTPCKIQSLQISRPCDFSPQKVKSWNLVPASRLKKPVKGWCSWYAYGFNISEKKIIDNAICLKKLWPGEDKYVLIDGGWTKDGDWENADTVKFPKGMKYMATQIKKIGLRPGIWISPFLADPNSEIVNKHPEYFIKKDGQFINGFNLFPFQFPFINQKYILDLEKPEVLAYLRECIHKIIVDWGYELLKLDFLYAIYFNPKYKTPDIPDQILTDFLTYIKRTYPNIYTIGCGCPLGPAAGLTDAMRISNDITTPQLDNLWPINSIVNSQKLHQLEQNLKYRKDFSKIWNIDPDVFVGRKSSGLSNNQIKKLYSLIENSKGLFFLGDDLTKPTLLFQLLNE